MRRFAIALLVLAGCSSGPEEKSKPVDPFAPAPTLAPRPAGARVDSPSDARDPGDLDPWNGKEVSLRGTFDHIRGIHGVVVLESGLRVVLLHFDLFARGDNWLKYVGKPCRAGGILHTYTKDIDGYRGPTLETVDFSGASE